jgi:DNA-binding MarR family transcriptional regulator
MERRGLVGRVECSEDGRGAFVVITPQGRAAIEEAAPGHVMAVRRLMFDALSEEEKAALAAVIDKLLARTDHTPTQ